MYGFLSDQENIHLNFGPVDENQKHPLEQVYLHNLFQYLVKWPRFHDFNFYLISAKYRWDYHFDKNSVVFYLSNEDHHVSERLLEARMIFSPYCPISNAPPNCFPIPLGYNGSLNDLDIKTIHLRNNDVFFSGNIHKRRIPFYLGAQKYLLTDFVKCIFKGRTGLKNKLYFNRSFGGGLNPDTYSNLLMDSKIALVPEGYKSDISFRFFEAAKYGNVIVTRNLYKFWFFDDFPGIQVATWWHLDRVLYSLLNNPDRLMEIHEKTIDYHNHYLTEEKVAEYIVQKIERS